jgi:SNF2 family DNA or RNA helicase
MEEIRGIVPDVPPVPEVEEHVVEFLTKKERVFYDEAGLGEIPLVRLLRLRQASVSPATFDPTWKTPSTKMVALGDLIEEGIKKDKRLVFCSFYSEMELITEYLQKRLKIDAEQYHGGLTSVERTEVLDRARDPSCQVLLIQLQAGGVGLNLQEFNRVVFMSPWWTSAMMDQAIARAVRMGQKRVVKVIHLLIDHEKGMNIDKFMGSKAEEKRKILKQEFFKHRVDLTTTKTTKTTSDVPVKSAFLKRKVKA